MPPRIARPRNVPSRDGKSIGWRFDLMDDERWPFPAPQDGLYPIFLDSLVRIGGIPLSTWDSPAHKEPLTNLAPAAQARLRDLDLEGVTGGELSKFQVSEIAGHARMWAIKNDNVYFLLWWDPDHEVERAAPSRRMRRKLRDRR